MAILTLEGTVENGQIRLPDDVTLPEHTKVYVVIPALPSSRPARIYSPRLVNPDQAADFEMQEIEVPADVRL